MPLDRRRFLITGGAAFAGLVATACSKGGGSGGGTTGSSTTRSLDDVIAGREQTYQLLDASSELLSGMEQRFPFGLVDSAGGYIKGGGGRLWVAKTRTEPAIGPIDFEYRGDGLDERDSRGVFVARLTFPTDGAWLVLAEAEPAGAPPGLAAISIAVGPRSNMPKPGDEAISVPTPTFDDHRGVDPICTLKPEPCSMHAISLDDALKNGKPTVLTIGTPAFCSSRLCGPVTAVIDDVAGEREMSSKLNWVHIEQYKDDEPETVQKQILAPAAQAWKLEFEPVVYFIDVKGTINERYIGPVDREDVREGARALLA